MVDIRTEQPADAAAIEDILDRSFGLRRLHKTSYRYRHGIAHEADLARVAVDRGRLVGSVRYWKVALRGEPVLLLGPLAIDPGLRNRGIGRALVFESLEEATRLGWQLAFLVGDAAYYSRFGFVPAPGSVVMPGEDPARLQMRRLAATACETPSGTLQRGRCLRSCLKVREEAAPGRLAA